MTPAISTVPFSKLTTPDAINARAQTKDGLDELAASIEAKGLIQPLAVRARGDTFEVIDGRRRHQAIAKLVKGKAAGWTKETPVPVLVRNEDDAAALETSLMANVVRLPMHPVDQYEVFARLAEAGTTDPDIAARFGITTKTVRQMRALGSLSPKVRAAWKADKIEADAAQVFTLCPDHKSQDATLAKLLKQYGNGVPLWAVRQELARDRVSTRGLSADVLKRYKKAGGTITDDLFSDARYVEDAALLKRVVADWQAEQCEAKIAELTAAGWAWVSLDTDMPHGWSWQWERVRKAWKLSAADQKRLDDLDRKIEATEDTEAANKLSDERDELSEQLEEAAQLAAFTAKDRKSSGVVLQVDSDGQMRITYGVLKPTGKETAKADAGDNKPAADKDDGDDALGISRAMTEALQTSRTVAAAKVLADDPVLALRVLIAQLRYRTNDSPLRVSVSGISAVNGGGHGEMDFVIPDETNTKALMKALAGLVSQGLDLLIEKTTFSTPKSCERHVATLIDALPGKAYLAAMRSNWSPADYFARSSKAVALTAIEEMRAAGLAEGVAPAETLAKAKKGDVAETAADAAAECGWLPPELRHPSYSLGE